MLLDVAVLRNDDAAWVGTWTYFFSGIEVDSISFVFHKFDTDLMKPSGDRMCFSPVRPVTFGRLSCSCAIVVALIEAPNSSEFGQL